MISKVMNAVGASAAPGTAISARGDPNQIAIDENLSDIGSAQLENSSGNSYGKMIKGDYVVHVLVQSTKNLDLEGAIKFDPYLQIKILNQSKNTSAKKDIDKKQSAVFNEHLFYEFDNIDGDAISDATIDIMVLNKGYFKGDQIGHYQINVQKVYNMKDHVMLHQQLAINNDQSDDFTKITGIIVVSINVQGPNDTPIELVMGSSKDVMHRKCLMPPMVSTKFKQFHFRLYQAQQLPKMDWDYNLINSIGTIDAYIIIRYNNQQLRSKVVKQGVDKIDVFWHEEFLLPIEIPAIKEKVEIEVWDQDKGRDGFRDELVGSFDINIASILKRDNTGYIHQLKWINLFGADVDAGQKGRADQMNRDAKIATHFKGRLLVEYFVTPGEEDSYCKFPEHRKFAFKESRLPPRINTMLKNVRHEQEYVLIGEFGRVICLPDDQQYNVAFSLAELSWDTKDCERKGKFLEAFRWDARFGSQDGKANIKIPYSTIKRFPTFYFYLLDERNKAVAYYRDSLENYKDPSVWHGPVRWCSFINNECYRKKSANRAAEMFSFRLVCFDTNKKDQVFNPKQILQWRQQTPKKQTPWKMRANIYQCHNLQTRKTDGDINPYIQVWTGEYIDPNDSFYENLQKIGKLNQTEYTYDTSNPIFYEVVEFNAQFLDHNNFEYANPLILNIYNKNTSSKLIDHFKDDEYLGRAVIHIKDHQRVFSKSDEIVQPQWFPIKLDSNDDWDPETSPAILCSFQMIRQDQEFTIPIDELQLNRVHPDISMPDLDISEYKVEIIALGLRSLISIGILPINRAFMKFNLKSLLPSSQAEAINNIYTQPNNKGPNPNIRTTIQFEVLMPSNPAYMQTMQVEVFDQSYVSTTFLGQFQVKLGEIFTQTFQRNKMRLAQIRKVKDEIKEQFSEMLEMQDNIDQIHNQLKNFYDKQRSQKIANIASDDSESDKNNETENQDSHHPLFANLKQIDLNQIQVSAKQQQISQKLESQMKALQENQFLLPSTGALSMSGKHQRKKTKRFTYTSEQNSILKEEDDYNNENQQKNAFSKKFGSDWRKEMEKKYNQAKNLAKKVEISARKRDQQAMTEDRQDAFDNIVFPQFEYDERLKIDKEKNIPPSTLFFPVGYVRDSKEYEKDKLAQSEELPSKHYRRYYPMELEKATDVSYSKMNLFQSPFMKLSIYRNELQSSNSLLKGLFGSSQDEIPITREVGYFKCSINCFSQNNKQQFIQQSKSELLEIMDIVRKLYKNETKKDFPFTSYQLENLIDQPTNMIKEMMEDIRECIDEIGLKQTQIFPTISDILKETQLINILSKTTQTRVQLYMLEGFQFADKDYFSKSDPYLIVTCGKDVHNDRKEYQLDTADPKFFKCYEFNVEFPGAPLLEIMAKDYDDFFGDDEIGSTTIDMDDRMFSQGWQTIQYKPIEYRYLYESSSTIPQGTIKMWLEIWNAKSSSANIPPLDITPEPLGEFEIRLCIYETKDIQIMDVEGTSDVFVLAYIRDDEKKKTDIHWRCQTGKASFNYRILLPTSSDSNKHPNILNIQAWDKDIFAADDPIGSAQMDIKQLVEDCRLTNKPQTFNKQDFKSDVYYHSDIDDDIKSKMEEIKFEDISKFWIPIEQSEGTGYILCEMKILPKDIAEQYPQGEGRENPNSDPFLPEPQWRLQMSWNPIDMFNQFVGPSVRRKIYCAICVAFCILLCSMMAPIIASNLLSSTIMKIFNISD